MCGFSFIIFHFFFRFFADDVFIHLCIYILHKRQYTEGWFRLNRFIAVTMQYMQWYYLLFSNQQREKEKTSPNTLMPLICFYIHIGWCNGLTGFLRYIHQHYIHHLHNIVLHSMCPFARAFVMNLTNEYKTIKGLFSFFLSSAVLSPCSLRFWYDIAT